MWQSQMTSSTSGEASVTLAPSDFALVWETKELVALNASIMDMLVSQV